MQVNVSIAEMRNGPFAFSVNSTVKCATIQGKGTSVKPTKESFLLNLCEPHHDKTNKVACAPSKDTGQPGHPPSLIRVFALRSVDS